MEKFCKHCGSPVEKYYSIESSAKLFDCSQQFFRNLIRDRKVGFVKVGRLVRIPHSELKHLKAMFNWALKMRILSRSPFLGIKFVKVEEKPIRFLSTDELKSLLAIIESAHDDEMFDLVQFYLQTGARASELLKPKFTWKSVDLQRGIIILIGKKRKRRTLPLNDLLKNMLQGRENIGSPFEFTIIRYIGD